MKNCLAVLCALLLSSCSSEPIPDRFEALFAGNLNVIDLTHSYSPDTPFWPSASGNPFKYEVVAAHESGKAMMGAYSTPEHFGTHLDAPIHGGDNLPTVDELTASDLFGPAAVIDVSARAEADPDYLLTSQDILDWEASYGPLPTGAIVLMYTGWSLKWEDHAAYANQDEDGRMHFPGFSEEVARFLVDERDIRAIGIDNMSVDYGMSGDFAAHGVTNGAGKYHLENVANLHLLPPHGATLIVAPIKIKGGSGGQVRIFAVLP